MKYLGVILMIIVIVPTVLFAQINWTEYTIAGNFNGASSVYAIDVDADGYVDVLGTAINGDDITWWENDGNENFTEHTINGNYDGASSVYALDVDDDNDIDILASAYGADDITWWENDGNENFTEHTIKGNYDGAYSVYAIDLDDDNDIDVLATAIIADDITWWENDGDENFTQHTIKGSYDGASAVFAIDLDDDNDIDVLGAARSADDITWWENDGDENFTEHTIKGSYDGASAIFAIDFDNDNDVDVLGTARTADDITWWENDGDENFTEHMIKGNFDGAYSVYALDLDDDEDIDVLGAASYADIITWWENDGSQNFTEHTIAGNFGEVRSVYALDLDGDSDLDVLGAAYAADDITWWSSDLKDIHDVGPVSIDIPETVPEHTILSPQATIKNFGNQVETFLVTCEIEPGAYTATDTVADVPPGDSIQITFSDDFTFESGSYTVTIYTQLESDENPANDTLLKEVTAINKDVGVASIDIPLQVPEFAYLVPKATVKNYGHSIETFDVTCKIIPGDYTSVFSVDTLVPDDSVSIAFEPSFVLLPGTYTVRVYTNLSTDMNSANDTLEKVIQTQDPGIAEGSSDVPEAFSFSAPTIIRGKAHIKLALPAETKVDLLVYDAVGRLSTTIVSNRLAAGTYDLNVNLHLPAGVYFYKLKTDSGEDIIQKFLLIE